MTVYELKKALELFADDTLVVIPGYEGGYSTPREAVNTELVLEVNDEDAWYYGPHEIADESTIEDYPNNERADAVVIR